MKIKFEELTPYLAHGLVFIKDGDLEQLHPLVGMTDSQILLGGVEEPIEISTLDKDSPYKPILIRCSDLDLDSNFKGKPFNPAKQITKTCNDFKYLLDNTIQIKKVVKEGKVNQVPFWVVFNLFRWKFDVFNLIPSGLAYDANKERSKLVKL